MSGHSQFKNIMYRKGAQDAKRAAAFAKIGREIFVAAKQGGSDPSANPRLRSALINARSVNMPSDNINRILKKALGGESDESYEEVRYEGFGVGGVAVIVEALTDNRNRTASDVRSTFTKFGGSLGELGSVSFMFARIGVVLFKHGVADFSTMFDAVADSEADDIEMVGIESDCVRKLFEDGAAGDFDAEDEPKFVEISCGIEVFGIVRDKLTNMFGEPLKSGIVWKANNTVECGADALRTVVKMIDVLEENEDVQNIFSNWVCSDEVRREVLGEA
jgi:YebC/PmpR family DNA-binding regulatory protein